ncbi:hypothetical protein NKH36_15640 [Mesorhizobium sp. M1312]|uniref:AbiTii domain-containing protein n=1 Tax=Mesorhizobium sp. M1312 TaxID=2957080 RepID=UPI00333BE8FD
MLDDRVGVGSILLKVRFLASKLGVDNLEEWVRHEAEGYPRGVEIPDYRKTAVSYTGTFSNGFQTLNNVSVAAYLIRKHGGDHWVDFEIRESLSLIDSMLAGKSDDAWYGIDTGNLKLLVQTKIYPDAPCVDLVGRIDLNAFARIQHAVRAKVLDLTLELEKNVPAAADITVGQPVQGIGEQEQAQAAQITQNTFYGDVTTINNSGDATQITLSVVKGDGASLIDALTGKGIPKDKANELAKIIEAEKPETSKEPLGKSARAWLKKAGAKGASEAWGIGKAALTEVATSAAKQYWGL